MYRYCTEQSVGASSLKYKNHLTLKAEIQSIYVDKADNLTLEKKKENVILPLLFVHRITNQEHHF